MFVFHSGHKVAKNIDVHSWLYQFIIIIIKFLLHDDGSDDDDDVTITKKRDHIV